MKWPSNQRLLAAGLILATLIALPGLAPRLRFERSHREAATVVSYRDVLLMAEQASLPVGKAFDRLREAGLVAIAVEELTGEEIAGGALPLWLGPKESLAFSAFEGKRPDLAVVWTKSEQWANLIRPYLTDRFGSVESHKAPYGWFFLLPVSYSSLMKAGVLPDLEAALFLKKRNWPLVYRPAPSMGIPTEAAVKPIRRLIEALPQIRAISPKGNVAVGFGDLDPLAAFLKEKGIAATQVEFSRQPGLNSLVWRTSPCILPLHSVTTDEVISRNLTRDAIVQRMIRAAAERSVKLLLLRPYEIGAGPWLDSFEEDLKAIARGLELRGISLDWPETLPSWPTSYWSGFAIVLATLTVSLMLWQEFFGRRDAPPSRLFGAGFLAFVAIGGVLIVHVSPAAKVIGALCAVLGASAATLVALNGWERPIGGILKGIGIAVAIGLVLSSFFGTPLYMLRLQAFSGVKATLLLPPLIVLAHAIKTRLYPEDFREIMTRSPYWEEIIVLAALGMAAGVMALRSGNVSLVPSWEVKLRDLFEQTLMARPRTKEILLGYPALWLWYIWVRLFPGEVDRRLAMYSVLIRMATSVAFASAVNSFCHFHTPLTLTLWRVFNGLWVGSLFGLFVGLLLWLVVKLTAKFRIQEEGEV